MTQTYDLLIIGGVGETCQLFRSSLPNNLPLRIHLLAQYS